MCVLGSSAFCVSSPEVLTECLLGECRVDGVAMVYPGPRSPVGWTPAGLVESSSGR